jgi:hypothetical protein
MTGQMSRHVYTQNLWSFLDVTFAVIYSTYLALRLYSCHTGAMAPSQQALDVLAMGAPVLIPRLAFNLLSDNLLFLSLRSMMADFTLLTVLAAWWVHLHLPGLAHSADIGADENNVPGASSASSCHLSGSGKAGIPLCKLAVSSCQSLRVSFSDRSKAR